MLETVNLTKKFGEHVAVSRVNLKVQKGLVHAAIGPNGAGKTTLFNLVTGVYHPDDGTVFFNGRDVTHMPVPDRVRLGLGRCFQKTNILKGLSVYENVFVATLRAKKATLFSFFGETRGVREARQATDHVLERVGLAHLTSREAQTIPHGDQRMLDVALALACEPQLLMLDEPTSGLSAGEVDSAMQIIASLSETHTILLIEHNMNVVMNVADKITVINFGEVIAEGPPEAIKADSRVQEAYFGGIL